VRRRALDLDVDGKRSPQFAGDSPAGPINIGGEPGPNRDGSDCVLGLFVIACDDVPGEEAICTFIPRIDPPAGDSQLVDDRPEINRLTGAAQIELMLESDDGRATPLALPHRSALPEREPQPRDDRLFHPAMRTGSGIATRFTTQDARIECARAFFFGSVAFFNHDSPRNLNWPRGRTYHPC
jgi:hypothetical protein